MQAPMGQTDKLETQDVQAGGLQCRAWCSNGCTHSCKVGVFLSDSAGSGTVGRAARRALQGGGTVLFVDGCFLSFWTLAGRAGIR